MVIRILNLGPKKKPAAPAQVAQRIERTPYVPPEVRALRKTLAGDLPAHKTLALPRPQLVTAEPKPLLVKLLAEVSPAHVVTAGAGEKRGGARTGAGRPPKQDAYVKVAVTLSQAHLDLLDEIGPSRSAALRSILDSR